MNETCACSGLAQRTFSLFEYKKKKQAFGGKNGDKRFLSSKMKQKSRFFYRKTDFLLVDDQGLEASDKGVKVPNRPILCGFSAFLTHFQK